MPKKCTRCAWVVIANILFLVLATASCGRGNTHLVQVVRVVDGDTVVIAGGERVRYIGIDTPETVDPRRPVQCYGEEASRKNKELVEKKYVRLESDAQDRDKYGRLLRYVWVDSRMVNLALVEEGFAHASPYRPNLKHQQEFREAEGAAQRASRGLWQACKNELPATRHKRHRK